MMTSDDALRLALDLSDVTVVAPPPDGEPRYKINRRYPPALGYVGTLDEQEVAFFRRLHIDGRSPKVAPNDNSRTIIIWAHNT